MTDTHLRWLLVQGYAGHAAETTGPDDPRRSFRPVRNLRFTGESCFVLTDTGAAHAAKVCAEERRRPARKAPRPHWDAGRRELWLGRVLVKRYRQPAEAQEQILATFEEEGWPRCIDDPLPPRRGQDPRKRLRSAVENLNRGQRLIHFKGGGDGQSVCWELRT